MGISRKGELWSLVAKVWQSPESDPLLANSDSDPFLANSDSDPFLANSDSDPFLADLDWAGHAVRLGPCLCQVQYCTTVLLWCNIVLYYSRV